MKKHNFREWLKRYLPAELIGTVTALGAALIAHLFTGELLLVAYVGSMGEAVGFYTTVFIQQFLLVLKEKKIKHQSVSFSDSHKIIGTMVLEFGPAGFIDGFLLRPLFMYLFPILLNNFTLGILIGKLTGDLTFYVLVILSYEIKKSYVKHKTPEYGRKNKS